MRPRACDLQPTVPRGLFARASLAMGLLLVIILGLSSRCPAEAPAAPRAWYDSAVPALERWIESERTEKEIPAISIAVVVDQQIVWARGFGFVDPERKRPATADTLYRVGSVSKLFTDIAAMQLVEQGLLNLDAPVRKSLSKFAPDNPYGEPVTVRQLMTHRSGLVREPPVGHYFDPTSPNLSETVASLNSTELVYPPGTHTKYSNAAISVVGAVVEQLRNEPFAQSVRRTVLEPMGLKRTSFEPDSALRKDLAHAVMWSLDGQKVPTPEFLLGTSAAGNLYSTVDDLAQFLSVLFAGGRGPGGIVLAPKTLQTMWTPQLVKSGGPGRFGLGFALADLDGHRVVGHGGAVYGFATEVAALPDDKLGVVVVASRDCANGLTKRIADTSLRFLLASRAQKPLPELAKTEPVPADLAQKLQGRYGKGVGGVDLLARDGKLIMMPLKGGFPSLLRWDGRGLLVDDVFSFGTKVEPKGARQLVIGEESLDRIEHGKPNPIPERWEGLIGEYGWDHNVLYILEKEGRLHALIEWFFLYPLEELGPNRFRFPDWGLYDSEPLIFHREGSGRATQVIAASVPFRRRAIDGEPGATFRIEPLHPVAELRVQALAALPPREGGEFLPADLVELTSLDPSIHLDIRYATANNFLSTPLYSAPRAFLQRKAAESLVLAHRALEPHGYGLLIHDAYRPWYVTKMFWEATPVPSRAFVADPAKGSKHNRGAAVDLTLYDRRTGQVVPMVGGYDEFSARSNPNYPGGTSLQRWHRDLLRQAMEDQGFAVDEVEWWHFNAKNWSRYPILNSSFEALATPRK